MNLVRFNHYPTFWNLLNDFDKSFNTTNELSNGNMPMVNIKNDDNNYVVELAAPGMSKEDFKINVENNRLVISSEKKEEKSDSKENYTFKEFSFNSFSKSFVLPKNIKVEDVGAKYENGILNVVLPKKEKEAVLSRSIDIK